MSNAIALTSRSCRLNDTNVLSDLLAIAEHQSWWQLFQNVADPTPGSQQRCSYSASINYNRVNPTLVLSVTYGPAASVSPKV
jgi:hypothetical protein